MKLPALLQQLKAQKKSLLSDDQKKAIAVGREQFQQLIEKQLTVPVAFL